MISSRRTKQSPQTVHIHVVDDDEDDRLLIRDAFQQSHLGNALDFTCDGGELMAYLRREGEFAHLAGTALPDIILIDLNMPGKDGRQCIREIRDDPALKHIPLVVLTTSAADEDVLNSYQLGVNSFITKPGTFDKMVQVLRSFGGYWLEVVRLARGATVP